MTLERNLLVTESAAIENRIHGVVTGRLIGLRETGRPVVDFPGNPTETALTARSVVQLKAEHVGREIVLSFESGDPEKPILLGVLEDDEAGSRVPVHIDHERLLLRAEREIVLECGKASITLTQAGKVLIRGAYVLSRSSGANRIKGGSVQIN